MNEQELKKIYGKEIKVPEKEEAEKVIEERFKDRKDPFRIVFVCAMWLTGFDVKPLTF
ncbi:type I restriction enzyme subunit R domain-containing protein, partial [Bacillus cereus]|uniref:type I restriction enzyme subunit R domain-containing protein n=1 Tax=Bacillus cereus TaxID=1396 RepID=UPI003F522523